ncbi:MAG: hypothetical protein AAF493_14580, partial [Pseudomonadota bacterium]
WTLEAHQLTGLMVTPPTDFSGDLSFRVAAVSTEHDGTFALSGETVTVPIEAVADGPSVGAKPEVGIEDQALALNLNVAVTDDSEQVVSVVLSDIPDGAEVLGATDNQDGTWSVALDAIDALAIIPPPHAHGSFSLTVSATSTEPNGDTATTVKAVNFSVASDPDAPAISAESVQGFEDQAIALQLSASQIDTDGSEFASVIVGGVPDGAVLSAGSNNGDGTWSMSSEALNGLTITPPQDFAGQLALSLTGVSIEMDTGAIAMTEALGFVVDVTGVADSPSIDAMNASTFEDTAVAIVLNAQLADTDGSEVMSAVFSNVPDGGSFSAGVKLANGDWEVSGDAFEGLMFTPPVNASGAFDLNVELRATETGGDVSTVTDAIRVDVSAVADAASMEVNDAYGSEDNAVALSLSAGLVDTDGSETLTLLVTGVPNTASLSAGVRNADGTYSVTPEELDGLQLLPPEHFSGRLDLTMIAKTVDENGSTEIFTQAFSATLDAVADAPTLVVADVSGLEDESVSLAIAAAPSDVDGSETVHVEITGVPDGVALSAGVQTANGTYLLTPGELEGLSLSAPEHWSGDIALTVTAVATEADGGEARSSAIVNVAVVPVADAADVTAENASGTEDNVVALRLAADLVDADGSESLTALVSGIPTGGSLTHGQAVGVGVWEVLVEDLPTLGLVPPENFAGTLELSLAVTSTEADNEHTSITNFPFSVTVASVADQASLVVDDAQAFAGDAVALDIASSLTDLDGSESLSVVLSGLPEGSSLNVGEPQADGTWKIDVTGSAIGGVELTTPDSAVGLYTVQVNAIATDGDDSAISQASLSLDISEPPPADAPSQQGVMQLDLRTLTSGFEESADVTLTIGNVPSGAALSAGVDQGDGSWVFDGVPEGGVQMTIPDGASGSVDLSLTATGPATNGEVMTAESTMTVDFDALMSRTEVLGTEGDDSLIGSAEDEVLSGGAGNDVLFGDGGNDLGLGGEGDDAFLFGRGDGQDVFVGGDGLNVVRLHEIDAGPSDSLQTQGDWTIALDSGAPGFEQTDNALQVEDDSSGVITFDDGSELIFHDVIRVEW